MAKKGLKATVPDSKIESITKNSEEEDETLNLDYLKKSIDSLDSEDLKTISEYLYHKIALSQFKKTNDFVDKMADLAKESGLEGIKLPKKITHYYVKNGIVKGRAEGSKGKKPDSELFEI